MNGNWNRRHVLRSAAMGVGASFAGWPGLQAITPRSAAAMRVDPEVANFRPEIEPIVAWIERTPRSELFDQTVTKLREGLSYRDLMAGLFLAGIRNIKPRPVGFKFHAVMVINSAHLLGQSAADSERLLPMFWALDNFKASQAEDIKEGDWTLGRVDEARLPGATSARSELERAFENWDSDAADSATAALCRAAGASDTMEVFWRCAVRDYRNIGHKPIFAMQCWRTLQAIGWSNAEPVLRSLAFGLLDPQGDSNPEPVGPYAANLERAAKFREGWSIGKADAEATLALLDTIRHASSDDSSAAVLKAINDGVAPESIWDAILLSGQEIMLRAPGIIPLHSVTAASALHYIYGAAGDPTTRKLALLQAAGWVPLYRERLGLVAESVIDRLDSNHREAVSAEALAQILDAVHRDRVEAAKLAAGYFDAGGSPADFFAAARRLIFLKGTDSHDYKFGAACIEEFERASDPRWRPALAASILSKVPDPSQPDSPLMIRAREAVGRGFKA
jgi:hypothetical protein